MLPNLTETLTQTWFLSSWITSAGSGTLVELLPVIEYHYTAELSMGFAAELR